MSGSRRIAFASVATLVSMICLSTNAAAQAPPSNLQAATIGSTVTFSWTAVGGASGYRLEAGGAPGGSEIATLNIGPSSSYAVPNVPGGVYYVRLRALVGGGASAPSNEVTVVVGGSGGGSGCPAAPVSPVGLRATVDGIRVTVSWSPSSVGCPATSYILQAGSSAGAADLAVVPTATPTLTANAPDGVYFVSIISVNAFGASPPAGGLIIPVVASTAGGTVGFNTATPAIAADSQGNAVIIGEVVNRSLAPAVFIQVGADLRDSSGASVGNVATFLRGQPRRLAATGVMDDSGLAPGEIGCFYLQTAIPVGSLRNANLQLSFETFASRAPRSQVNAIDVTRVSSPGAAVVNVTAANLGPEATFFNLANVYLKRPDGRAVGCDFMFVGTPNATLVPGQTATLTATTHAPASAASAISWMHWQEAGDPLAGLAAQTFEAMRAAVSAGQKQTAIAAWEALQEQRRAFARGAGR